MDGGDSTRLARILQNMPARSGADFALGRVNGEDGTWLGRGSLSSLIVLTSRWRQDSSLWCLRVKAEAIPWLQRIFLPGSLRLAWIGRDLSCVVDGPSRLS
jgi:hypothetical protein